MNWTTRSASKDYGQSTFKKILKTKVEIFLIFLLQLERKHKIPYQAKLSSADKSWRVKNEESRVGYLILSMWMPQG